MLNCLFMNIDFFLSAHSVTAALWKMDDMTAVRHGCIRTSHTNDKVTSDWLAGGKNRKN